MNWTSLVPALDWARTYNTGFFRKDFLAGLTVAIMLIPQGMAYALLAGLPPIYGLYASIVPLVLYLGFGSSRQLSVGPVAIVSLLVLASLSEMAAPQSPEFISLAITAALMAGLIQVVLGSLRLGFLIEFLSHPVLVGFTAAAALIIGFSQVKFLFGISLERVSQLHVILIELFGKVSDMHALTAAVGFGSLLLMILIRKLSKRIPSALAAVVVATLVVWAFRLDELGVQVVGSVPKGLPSFLVPDLSLSTMEQLLPLALTICLISFIESLAIAKNIQKRDKSYRIVPNQELLALGISKIAGSFFQAFPTTGSFTRSAINFFSGAKTGVSSLIAAGVVALSLLFLTPLFYFIPNAVLGAIVVMAVAGLIEFKEIRDLWRFDRKDFLSLLTTFLVTLFVGVQEGVLTGVILSLGFIIYRSSYPHVAILGRLPGSTDFRNLTRFPEATTWDDILIMRFDAQLYFGNAKQFQDIIEDLIGEKGSSLKYIILDGTSITDVDSTGFHMLHDLIDDMRRNDIELHFAGCPGPVRDLIYKTGTF
ncbi:MAG: solute carrier family 26 protein, partial [Saprospiraceae bacterium]|nr:solute carrier family 26 protein [Saprospiraceae bacterium]